MKFEKVRIPGSGFEIKLNGGQIRAQNAKLCLKTYFYNLFKKNFSGPMKVMITSKFILFLKFLTKLLSQSLSFQNSFKLIVLYCQGNNLLDKTLGCLGR